MATEALVTDQTAEGHVEKVKLTANALKDAGKKINVEDSSGIEASTVKSEAAILSEEEQEAKKSDPAADELKKEEAEDANSSEPSVDNASEKERTSVLEADSSTADAEEEVNTSAGSLEASANDSCTTLLQELESKTGKKPIAPEASAEVNTTTETTIAEVNATEELPQDSSVSVTERKEAEQTIVSHVTEKPLSLQEEPPVTDKVPEVALSQSEVAVVTEASPVKELKEEEERKDASVEGEKTTLVEKLRDTDVEEGKNINTEGEKAEKGDDEILSEIAKDTGAAPNVAVSTKCPQCQSNNILSKVKRSIVKVKKAIIGKSPSSKAMYAEGKDELKIK